jgi:hypothetical protein
MRARRVTRIHLPLLALAAIVAVPWVAVAAGPVVIGPEASVAITPGPPPIGVLYDQTDSPAGAGFTSQVFEPASSAFDCRAGDDFTVPAPDVEWDIAGIVVLGAYLGSGPTPLIDVEVFTDGGSIPSSTALCSYIGLQAGVDFTDDGNGNLDIALPTLCVAPAGDYWLSVRADMDSTVGQWLWVERTTQSGASFAWENPGDGFGTGCVSWTPAGGCGASSPDLLFALFGVAVPVELQSITVD